MSIDLYYQTLKYTVQYIILYITILKKVKGYRTLYRNFS